MKDPKTSELKVEELLRWTCNPEELKQLQQDVGLEVLIGQERAVEAIKTGLAIENMHFNLYISGLSGTMSNDVIKHAVEQFADMQNKRLFDFVYVYNFEDSDQPKWLRFEHGQGKIFKKEMEDLIENLKKSIPEAMADRSYIVTIKALREELALREKALIGPIREEANVYGLALGPNQGGTNFVVGMLQQDQFGQFVEPNLDAYEGAEKINPLMPPATSEEPTVYTDKDIQKLKHVQKILTEKLEAVKSQLTENRKELVEKEKGLKRSVINSVVSPLIGLLKSGYNGNEKVLKYLDEVGEDILEHTSPFEPQQKEQQPNPMFKMMGGDPEDTLEVYDVNLFHSPNNGNKRPLVVEINPHFKNLVGRIEKGQSLYGDIFVGPKNIKEGSISKANDGFLLLNVYDLFQHPQAWEALKRVLKTGQLQIEDIYETIGLETKVSASIKPEPIPINVKVIMTGDERAYCTLMEYEPDFRDLFKIKVEFDEKIKNDGEGRRAYVSFAKRLGKEKNLLPVEENAVAALIEEGARMAGSQEKLSTDFTETAAILMEADHIARTGVKLAIRREEIELALESKLRRNDLYQKKSQEIITKGLFLVSTEGKEVGQINGLAVYVLADYRFGVPTRITANTSVGSDGLISVDREAGMTGPIHDKGAEIISSYLRRKFGQDKTISVTASLSFEQNYGGIEGDSASSTELYALLSSLSGLPIKQGIAVTGSVNQKGEVQVIGAVNEKIEGWYDVCKAKGLTGEQGVLIPAGNIKDLMLKKEVVKAVREGKFHIYPVSTIEEGIEILTDVEAGRLEEEDEYTKNSCFGRVDEKLREFNYYAIQEPEKPESLKKKGSWFGFKKKK